MNQVCFGVFFFSRRESLRVLISSAANSLERHRARVLDSADTDELQVAAYKWSTGNWAYEAWKSNLFMGIYRELKNYHIKTPYMSA